uniref:Tubby C-terminal domain-containing protein n=1 Tax=Ditylum brightwellii TaxID=49249 RepID=A0A7S4S614_9STRA
MKKMYKGANARGKAPDALVGENYMHDACVMKPLGESNTNNIVSQSEYHHKFRSGHNESIWGGNDHTYNNRHENKPYSFDGTCEIAHNDNYIRTDRAHHDIKIDHHCASENAQGRENSKPQTRSHNEEGVHCGLINEQRDKNNIPDRAGRHDKHKKIEETEGRARIDTIDEKVSDKCLTNGQQNSDEDEVTQRKLMRSNTSKSLFDDKRDEAETKGSGISRNGFSKQKNIIEESEKEMPTFSFDFLEHVSDEEMRKFLTKPCPKNAGTMQCYIKRNKGKKNKLFPEYRVYAKDGDVFMMTSKKRAKKKTSNYLISMHRNLIDKNSPYVIGKLRSNFFGTEYQLYDAGINPRDIDPYYDENNDTSVRSEIGAVLYENNVAGSRGPRRMQVCINKVDDAGDSTRQWQPAHKDEEMLSCFKHCVKPAIHHLISMENKVPSWNEELEAYVLDFNGRVTLASVKNFQLTEMNSENQDRIILQFGRVAKDEFTMDFQWPMSPLQAFAIVLSSCDSKIACD